MNDPAMQTRCRNILYERAGLDCFLVMGFAGQDPVTFRHQEGEAHKRLLDGLLREQAEMLDPVTVDDEEWRDEE